MAISSEKAKALPRDTKGKYIKVHRKTEGAGDIISKLIKTEKGDDDETLIDVKVTNPLHKIVQVLQEIKNHQSTTVSLRFTIPLIALPIIILLAFQIGRSQTFCSQGFMSKTGTIKNLFIQAPSGDSGLFHFIPFSPVEKISDPSKFTPGRRTILLSSNGETTTVLSSPAFDLSSYENQNVIISGNYSSCSQTITLDSPQNISFLNQ